MASNGVAVPFPEDDERESFGFEVRDADEREASCWGGEGGEGGDGHGESEPYAVFVRRPRHSRDSVELRALVRVRNRDLVDLADLVGRDDEESAEFVVPQVVDGDVQRVRDGAEEEEEEEEEEEGDEEEEDEE